VTLRVRLDELVPTKTAARQLPQQLERLERGDADHLVLTTRNVPRAVLITLERYEQLLAAEAEPVREKIAA
jgi:PHD/YefM family antitoxin component YafN of YafNO toxin-antitoxin module